MRLLCSIAVTALLLFIVSDAPGAIMFLPGQPEYTLLPGESVVVPISLEFTGSDAADLASDGGLLSAAFRVVQTGTPPASPVTPTFLSANISDFNDPTLTPVLLGPSPTQAGIWEFTDISSASGVVGQSSGPDGRIIPLGQVTFAAGSTPGQTTFQAEAYDPTLQTTVTFDLPSITLDGSIVPSSITFDVVPEPRLGLALLAAVMLVPRRQSGTGCQPVVCGKSTDW